MRRATSLHIENGGFTQHRNFRPVSGLIPPMSPPCSLASTAMQPGITHLDMNNLHLRLRLSAKVSKSGDVNSELTSRVRHTHLVSCQLSSHAPRSVSLLLPSARSLVSRGCHTYSRRPPRNNTAACTARTLSWMSSTGEYMLLTAPSAAWLSPWNTMVRPAMSSAGASSSATVTR